MIFLALEMIFVVLETDFGIRNGFWALEMSFLG
jgi:hypothetical protein